MGAVSDTLPAADAQAALEEQVRAAEDQLAEPLPRTPVRAAAQRARLREVRAAGYGAAVGDSVRWPGADSGNAPPAQYESAGKRRDGSISREASVALRRVSREASVALRRTLIELGIGL